MLLVLSFVLFSGWYAGSPLPLSSYPMFASLGLFVAFGGSNIALPFLLDMFRLPADMFELFLVANVITNLFFMALSAMNLVVLTLLAMFLIKRRVTPKPVILVALLAVLVVGAPLLLRGAGLLIDRVIDYEYSGYNDFVARGLTGTKVQVRTIKYQQSLSIPQMAQPRLESTKTSGWLRVGHSVNALPWAFRNDHGDTVGYDMELLHRLAGSLGVGIEIMRLEPAQVAHAIASGQIDIYASGMMIDAGLLGEFSISEPYSEISLGLLVKDHLRQDFETIEQLRRLDNRSIGVLQSQLLLGALETRLPDLEFVKVRSPREFLKGELTGMDALVMSAEAASAWTLVYPQYSAVIPSPARTTIPIVFALPGSDEAFEKYVNIWIQAAKSLGVMDLAYEHWILGRDTAAQQPRWSVIRDVLHWVD
jgi:ABC-type amino acid transport substrate-binding protein